MRKLLLLLVLAVLVAVLAALITYRVDQVQGRQLPARVEVPETVRWLDELGRLAETADGFFEKVGIDGASWPIKIIVNSAFTLLLNPPDWLFPQSAYKVEVSDKEIAGVPTRVYVPLASGTPAPRPTIIYFHAGGWTWFSAETFDNTLKYLSNKLGFMIIAPSFRTAPQHPFPAAYDDCLAVTSHVLDHATSLGVKRDTLIVAGEGSGGNLAAAVAQTLRGRLTMQILITPALQTLNFATPSYQDNAKVLPGLTSPEREVRHWLRYAHLPHDHTTMLLQNLHASPSLQERYRDFLDSRKRVPKYLNVTKLSTQPHRLTNYRIAGDMDRFTVDERFCPMLVENVTGVANAYFITAQYDVLRDEAIMYSHRLHQLGVKVKLRHYDSAFHGFFSLLGNQHLRPPVSVKAIDDLAEFIEFQFGAETKGS